MCHILEMPATKTVTGTTMHEGASSDFASEIDEIKKNFLNRRQAGNQRQILE
jgi:hypothetical protein